MIKKYFITMFVFFLFISTSYCENNEIKLWNGNIPNSKNAMNYKEKQISEGWTRIEEVTDPELLVYLPPKEKASGCGVIICPGGGYSRLAIDHEGKQVAQWLADMGIAGFVLKYRLPNDKIMENKSIGPLQDVQQAIRLVRKKSKEWNLSPNKIGVMGFSAGGHLAASASTLYDDRVYASDESVSARPDFSLLIYGVLSMITPETHTGTRNTLLGENSSGELLEHFSAELQVNSKTPPAFIVHSADDEVVPVENSLLYFKALVKNHISAELHIYQQGGHGYGLALGRKSTEADWPKACKAWLINMNFLTLNTDKSGKIKG